MRPLPILILLAGLSACEEAKPDPKAIARAEAGVTRAAAEDGQLLCALDGAAGFARVCTIDREVTGAGLMLTVRRPDGGFHRLLVTRDGRGVVAADGAELAKVSVAGANEIEVSVGGDRVRLPATVRGTRG